MNAVLYALVVLIFGTTWIAITLQSAEIAPVVAVFWRFFIAGALLMVALLISRRLTRLKLNDHLFCLLQGLCIFSLNFICFYIAVRYISSGLESVIFSMAVLFNTLNSYFFFRQPISAYFLPAFICGLLSMIALFWHDLATTQNDWQTVSAILLCVLGTYGFSLGNMISLRHQKQGCDVLTTNTYAMLYGAIVMAVIIALTGQSYLPESSVVGWSALMYLALIGSVLGFSIYFMLIRRIGAGPAAYSTLLFPLVALTISTFFEGYQWTWSAVFGVMLILLGNLILFIQPKGLPFIRSNQRA